MKTDHTHAHTLFSQPSSSGNATNTSLWSAIHFQRSANGTTNISSTATTQNLRAGGGSGGDVCCWETVIGQELYKLTITYFAAELLSIAFADALRWAVVQGRLCPRLAKMVS